MNSLVIYSGIGLVAHAAVVGWFVGAIFADLETLWQRVIWAGSVTLMWLALFGLARVLTIGLGETL